MSRPETARIASSASDRLVNLRDLGGLPIVGGGVTRHGVLYRGDASYSGDLAPLTVAIWPPKVVIDLRTEREAARMPYTWPERTQVLSNPLHEAAVPENIRTGGGVARLYAHILDEVPERVAGAVDLVTTAPVGPVLLHCAAGKDRTGIVVAALLLAAGVEQEAVIADYAATAVNMAALERRWLDKGVRNEHSRPLPDGWLLAPAASMATVVERLTAHPCGVVGWLVANGASRTALDAWTTRLAEHSEELRA